MILELLSDALLVMGTLLALSAGAGLLRFDDVFAQMHAATKPATLGLVLVLSGSALRLDDAGDIAKLLLVVVLQFVTAPVGGHMLARAAYRIGVASSPTLTLDELAGAIDEIDEEVQADGRD